MQEGVTVLKEGWAELKDETQDGEGAWENHWFTLKSSGELRIYPHAESTDEQLVRMIHLKNVERVERSKGMVGVANRTTQSARWIHSVRLVW